MATVVDKLVTEYSLKDDYSAPAEKVTKTTNGMAGAFSGATSNMAGLADALSSGPVQGAIKFIIGGWTAVIGAVASVGAGLVALGVESSKQAASMESDRLALSAYTHSAEELNYELGRLKEVARLPGLGLQEAIRGSSALQAVGFDSRMAERALLAFGNALASVGRGKDDLDGVIVALSQIVSKGTVSAEEINQIAERVPQIRAIMASAFGTADTEQIAKNFSVDQFISGIIAGAEKLPKVAGGAANAFENASDAIKNAMASIGDAINAYAVPAINKIADFINFLADSGTFNAIADQFATIFGGATWGDTLVDLGASIIAAFQQIPPILYMVQVAGQMMFRSLVGQINGFIESFNSLMNNLRKWDFLHIIPGGELQRLGASAGSFIGSEAAAGFAKIGDSYNKSKGDILAGFNSYKPSDTISKDSGGGSITTPARAMAATASNTAQMVQLQKEQLNITKSQLGGGNNAKYATSAVNLSRAGKTNDPIERGVRALVDAIREQTFGAQLVQAQHGYR